MMRRRSFGSIVLPLVLAGVLHAERLPGSGELRTPWSRSQSRVALRPEILASIDEDRDGVLSVRVDEDTSVVPLGDRAVRVEVIAAGGRIAGAIESRPGASFRFDTTTWPEGAYEVRCSTKGADGRAVLEYLPWYKGDVLAACRALLATADRADTTTARGMVQAVLAELVRSHLDEDADHADGDLLALVHSP